MFCSFWGHCNLFAKNTHIYILCLTRETCEIWLYFLNEKIIWIECKFTKNVIFFKCVYMSVCLFVSLYAYTSAGNDISVWLGFFFDKNLNNRKNYHKIFKLFGLEITLKNKALTCFFCGPFFFYVSSSFATRSNGDRINLKLSKISMVGLLLCFLFYCFFIFFYSEKGKQKNN